MSFLDSHGDGCKPLEPCKNCQVAAFLKEKLAGEDFDRLLDLLGLKVQTQTGQVPLDTPLRELQHFGELTVRARNALHNECISTVRDLVSMNAGQLLRVPNFGRKSLNEVKLLLDSCGYHLSLDPVR
jgi:DNA-directed RNA polymerase alpha subunit